MHTAVLCSIYMGVTMVVGFVNALNGDDEGVCSKSKTYATSQLRVNSVSFARSYETCTWGFCSTKYRTAYRSETRTIYRTSIREYLTCCEGFSEVGAGCELKVPSTMPMTSSSTTTPLTPMSTRPITVHSTAPSSPADVTSSPDMGTALPGTMSAQTKIIIFGVVVVVAVVVVILLLIVGTRRRRKRQSASSSENTEGREFTQPQGTYFSLIRSTIPDSDGTDADLSTVGITQLAHDPSSGAQTKKNTFKNLSVFYAKIMKGKQKARGSDVQSHDSGRHATDNAQEDTAPYNSCMDSANTTPTKQPQGYVDMASPTRSLQATNVPSTSAQVDGNEYSTMDSPRGLHEYSEFEPYDKLNHPDKQPSEKESPDATGYHHLERTDSSSLMHVKETKPAGDNPYDKVGGEGLSKTTDSSTPPRETEPVEENPYDKVVGEASTKGGDSTGHRREVGSELYDQPKPIIEMKKSWKHGEGGGMLREGNLTQHEESMYYNTPEENALMRRKSQQDEDAIYSNVS